uniref:RING-type domain-containing protein n=1 Tax=Caenorhabditis tropicalis TaxID=1561998 RepID=A0A1I7T8Y9_9PELO
MRIYGNEEKLLEDIRMFMSFPGSDSHFQIELAQPIMSPEASFKSLKGEKYMFKQNIFVVLQGIVDELEMGNDIKGSVMSLIGYFLKTNECQITNTLDLVFYPEEELNQLKKDVENAMKVRLQYPVLNVLVLQNVPAVTKVSSVADAIERIKLLLSPHPNDPDYESIHKTLETLLEKPKVQVYKKIIDHLEVLLAEFKNFIGNHPSYFLPGLNGPPRVRLFDNGKHKFVFAYELLNEMERTQMDDAVIKKECPITGGLETIDYDKLSNMIDVEEIEFIITPIVRTKHRAVFIPHQNGKYCIQIVDYFTELIREMINVTHVYHGLDVEHKSIIQHSMLVHEMLLFSDQKCRFLDIEQAIGLRTQFFKDVDLLLPRETRGGIRQISKIGFTVKDAFRELERLGINETFDHRYVRFHAVMQFRDMVGKKDPREKLTMTDFLDLLENIQFCCALKDYSNIYEMIHKHGMCSLIPHLCRFCHDEELIMEEEVENKIAAVIQKIEEKSQGDLFAPSTSK